MNPVYITGLASFLPNGPVTNDKVDQVLGKLERQPARVKNFVLNNNGIKTRYYAIDPKTHKKTHTNAQLAAEAVRTLLEEAGLSREELEGLACGTSSSDQLIPSHANMVAGELKLPPSEIVSTAGVCASGMTALKYAYMNVALGFARNFATSGSECASAFMDKKHYDPIVHAHEKDPEASPIVSFEKEFLRWMLSDGAGAALLEGAPRPGATNLRIEFLAVRSWAGLKPVCMYAGMVKNEEGGFTYWFEEEDPNLMNQKGYLLLQQDARALEEHMVAVAGEGLQYLIEHFDLDVASIDWFLPHLSSMYFKGRLQERLEEDHVDIPEEKWFTNLAEKGNTGSASIYIILDELIRSGRAKRGDRILCAVPESARFTMAGMLLTVC